MDVKKFCSHCGAPIEGDSKFCSNCGANLEESKAEYYQSGNSSYDPTSNSVSKPASSSNGIAALIFGILSLFMGGLLFSILAIYFGSKDDDTMSKVGKVLGIISLVLYAIVIIIVVITVISGIAVSGTI